MFDVGARRRPIRRVRPIEYRAREKTSGRAVTAIDDRTCPAQTR